MEELMQKLSGYLDAAAGVITEYAPQAVDAALFVVRFDAIWTLFVSAVIAITMALVATKAHKLLHPKIVAMQKLESYKWHPGWHLVWILGVVGSAMIGVRGLNALLHPYNWLAAFDPTLGLVYKAAQSAGLL